MKTDPLIYADNFNRQKYKYHWEEQRKLNAIENMGLEMNLEDN